HGVAYDQLSNRVIGGTQDTGTPEQILEDGIEHISVLTADGGDVAVDNAVSDEFTFRYSSFQNLSAFTRRSIDQDGNLLERTGPGLIVTSGPPLQPQFYSPLRTNPFDGNRLLIGAFSALYESLDAGQTIASIGEALTVNAFTGDPLIYGVPDNADLVLAGVGADLYSRTLPPPAQVELNSQPTGASINSLAINPDNPDQLFALSTDAVAVSDNFGADWQDVTGNLLGFSPRRLRAMAFAPAADSLLFVGSDRGVYVARASTGYSTWAALGADTLPNAPVYELVFNREDSVLIASQLGRGAWKRFFLDLDQIFVDGFEE
ncbi:MAG: hypothetical protein AAGH65_07370, partial [Pseudomonadota bacterium]